MIYQRNSAKLGVLTLIPVIKGMKIKKGNVLMYRKDEEGNLVTEAYELNKLPFKIPMDVLDQFGYTQDEILELIQSKLGESFNIIKIGGVEATPKEESDEEKLSKLLSALLAKR